VHIVGHAPEQLRKIEGISAPASTQARYGHIVGKRFF
jgi:hypothetical protein